MAHIVATPVTKLSFLAPFAAIGRGLVWLAENNTRMRQVEKLNNMSDEALAEQGLKREDIVRHIFRDTFYV